MVRWTVNKIMWVYMGLGVVFFLLVIAMFAYKMNIGEIEFSEEKSREIAYIGCFVYGFLAGWMLGRMKWRE